MWIRLNSGVTPGTCMALKSASTMLLVLGARTPNFLRQASWSCDMSGLHRNGRTVCCAPILAQQAVSSQGKKSLRHCIGPLFEPLMGHVLAVLAGAQSGQREDDDRVDDEQRGGQARSLALGQDR